MSTVISFQMFKNGVFIGEQALTGESIKIGRMPSSGLHIDDPSVSKMHAVVEVGADGSLKIVDLGSATGVMVNGVKVETAVVREGDNVVLGDVEIRVVTVAVAVVPPPVPASMSAVSGGAAGVHAMGAALPAVMDSGVPAHYVDLGRYEDASKEAVEVVVMWNNSVLQVVHYKPEDNDKAQQYLVGEDFSCNFPMAAEFLHGRTRAPLVERHVGGGATVHVFEGADGDVTFEDGTRTPFSALLGSHLQPAPNSPGDHVMALPRRGRMKIDFGAWTFLVNAVPAPRKFTAPLTFDWASQVYTGISGTLHALALFLMYFIPPSPDGLSLDQLDADSRFIKIMMAVNEVKVSEIPDFVKQEKEDEAAGGTGERHKGAEGAMGKTTARDTGKMYGIAKRHDGELAMQRSMEKQMATSAGILGYLTAANVPDSPFGATVPNGMDPEDALGALMGKGFGDSFGYGGLGLSGTGRGGGGTGEGTIGIGRLGTIGHGGGRGTGVGYGNGGGDLTGRAPRTPRIRSGAATVQGSLSKDVIRRVIQRHLNEVKFCYEKQLVSRPDLEGRVAIRFIINGTGGVQAAVVAETSLGNATTESCIAQAVKRWTFPQPKGGGVVIVTYPFQLQAPR